ncbi:MAG: histidine kinase dimerization/phospho-acceptor domain-containing protein [Myxococcota bacterium]
MAVPWVFVRRAGAYVLTTVPEDAVRFIERTIARATDFARAESVLDAMGEGVLLADANGVIAVATVRAGALLQTTPAALEGQPLASVIPAIHALEPGEIVRGSLRDKGLHFTVHHQAPATQPDPTPDAAPGLLVRLRSDERFAPTRQRQMQLLSILRHDVRSPLTSVRGLVSVLLDEPDMPREERLGLLDLLRQEAERTVTWVEDYLVVLRLRLDPRPQHMVACELGGWMETLERVFARHAEERHITLRMERPAPKRFEVQAEPALLESFGKNLVGHAFRLADAGATIDVRVVPEDGSFEVRARGPGLFGVPPRQPFTTLARSTAAGKRTPGVGLGLFLAKKIADAHGWRIEARQELEGGLSLHTRWG